MQRSRPFGALVLGLVAPFLVHCGGASATGGDQDAGADSTPADTAAADTGGAADGDADTAPACVEGGPCTDNPGVACRAGVISCATGAAKCVDGAPVADGTTCSAGVCAHGRCLGPTAVSADHDLSAKTLTVGRICADSPSYSVVAFGPSKVSLATAPVGDCLAPGDEVLLIDLQGAPGATANVGAWELLEVKTVAGKDVVFTTPKVKSYGATKGSDDGVGVGAGQQKVALVRVATFGALTIAAGAKVTTQGWAGAVGGVLALRAASLKLDGTITVSGLGYRGGRWSRDGDCTNSVQTEAGESIDGPSTATTANHFGGPGGIGPGSTSFLKNDPISPGAGHSGVGEAGLNGNGRTMGGPGTAYGAKDATLLTMGSGQSGNLTCEPGVSAPYLVDSGESLAGGIALLLVRRLEVGPTGVVTASAASASRDVSAAGGYVYVRGEALEVGDGRITALGGVGTPLLGPFFGSKVKSSDGYVVLAGKVTGTTKPAAFVP